MSARVTVPPESCSIKRAFARRGACSPRNHPYTADQDAEYSSPLLVNVTDNLCTP
jgi:hypothetical protein